MFFVLILLYTTKRWKIFLKLSSLSFRTTVRDDKRPKSHFIGMPVGADMIHRADTDRKSVV